MNPQDYIDYINGRLTFSDRLCQLAEEASELAKAALKLKRAQEGTNPTPVSTQDAILNCLEEIGDVLVCITCTFPGSLPEGAVTSSKLERWAERLKQAEGPTQ